MTRPYTVRDTQYAALRKEVYRTKGKYPNARAETIYKWLKPKFVDYLNYVSQIEALLISYDKRRR
jgi:hypothetical protein